MVVGIHITFKKNDIIVKKITPSRAKYLVIFSNNGDLLLWEPTELKTTKTDMKKYVLDVAQRLSDKLGSTSVLAHGLFKYNWIGNTEYEILLGGVTIGNVTYKDTNFDDIEKLEYRPRFAALNTISNFI